MVTAPVGEGEGMWPLGLLPRLDEEQLRRKGLQMPLASIWSNEGGLARAAVKLVNGCSASFVSARGLIATNHHCAHGAISRNSTEDNNLLETGFTAASLSDELPGHGTAVQVLQTFVEVTDRILADLPEDLAERGPALDRMESEIVAECERAPHRRCYVGRFLDGVPYAGEPDGRPRFFLFETVEIRDVRLVAAPPESVGSYGGEIDNWHWPRHSGDFTLLRAYVAPDGSPAEYDEANVPYEPDVHLTVSTEGVQEGDFVMVMGYPWHTTRHLTATEVIEQRDWYYPQRLELFGQWAGVLHEQAQRSEQVRILVAPQARGVDNALSHAKGRTEAFRNVDVIGQRQDIEQRLTEWVNAEPSRQAEYGQVLSGIADIVAARAATRDRNLLLRFMTRGSQLLGFGRTITKWAAERQKPDLEREPGYQDRDETHVRSRLEHAQRSLDVGADQAVFTMMLTRALALPEGQRVAPLDELVGEDRSPTAIAAAAASLYNGSPLGDQAQRLATFGQDQATLAASSDTMVQLALALTPLFEQINAQSELYEQQLALLRPKLMQAIQAMTGALLYPDATSTPRVSLGNVRGYRPRDGVLYTPLTTVEGLVAKDRGEFPFNAPQAVLERAPRAGQTPWVDGQLGDVPSCFLSDVDTTGGNSGSPLVDGQGRLVGLLFDGVWEDLAGDISYSPRYSRSISVDIRYVLWLLDEVMEADHLIAEMGAAPSPSAD
jgi:hypothetical protein